MFKINDIQTDCEAHIIFKEDTEREDPKFQINIISLNFKRTQSSKYNI